MGNGSETVVKISPDNSKDKPAVDKPKFESLTLEERGWLVARLEALRHRGLRENPAWKAELVVVLKSTPILDPILKMLEADDLPTAQPATQAAFEQKITQVIEAALRVVSASSAPALGDGLRYLVAQEVEKVIWQSQTVGIMRWGAAVFAAALGAGLLGGTLWGAYKIDGLNKFANDSEVKIRDLRDDAQKRINQQIQDEVAARTKKLDDMFVGEQKKAETGATDKLKAFDQALGTLNSDYTGKSQTAFKIHNEATDKLWETQDQNWVKALIDRRDVVDSHFKTVQSNVDTDAQTFKTNLDTTLREARQKTPELESKIQALENQSTKIDQQVKTVDEHVGSLVATHRQLDDLINKLNEQSGTGGFLWLIRVLDIKDGLAVAAIILAFLCFVYIIRRILFAPFSWLYRKLAG